MSDEWHICAHTCNILPQIIASLLRFECCSVKIDLAATPASDIWFYAELLCPAHANDCFSLNRVQIMYVQVSPCFSLFGEIELIKYVCSSGEPTDAEFGLNSCFSRPERPTSGPRSLGWNATAAASSCGWSACHQCLPLWLAAFFCLCFFPSSSCQMLSAHVYSCCHRMLYSSRWQHLKSINEKLVKK